MTSFCAPEECVQHMLICTWHGVASVYSEVWQLPLIVCVCVCACACVCVRVCVCVCKGVKREGRHI